MKKTAVWVAILLAAAASRAGEINVGDSADRVISVLGEPMASIVAGTFQLLTFERGRVELRNDKVVEAQLISQEEADRRRLASRLRAEEDRKLAALHRRELIAEGLAVLERNKNDAAFRDKPASDQVNYWRAFQRSYPDVNAGAEYLAALNRMESEVTLRQQTAEQERKIRELEDRVSAAEQRAQAAEARSQVSYNYYGTAGYRPAYYVNTPSCNVRPVCRTVYTGSAPCARPVTRSYVRHSGSGLTVTIGSAPLCRSTSSSYISYRAPGLFVSSAFH